MLIEFDPVKDAINIEKHHISLARFQDMDEASLIFILSPKTTSDAARYIAFGTIDNRLYRAILTFRGDTRRIVSLHKANSRDQRKYVKAFHAKE